MQYNFHVLSIIFFFLLLGQLWPKPGALHLLVLLSNCLFVPLFSAFLSLSLFFSWNWNALRELLFGLCREKRYVTIYIQYSTQYNTMPILTAFLHSWKLLSMWCFSWSAFHPSHYNPFMSAYLPHGAVGMTTPPAANNTTYSMEQMMWLQQQAYVQYMTNYFQL